MDEIEYCQLVNILIPKYVKGQCTKAEGAFLGEHCAVCPECRARLAWAFEEAQITYRKYEKDEAVFSLPKSRNLSQKEILFLSHPRNLILSKKSGSKEIKQEANTNLDYVIDWKDSVLESRMRDNIGIFYRDLRYKDVKDIKELDLSSIGNEKISDISALSVMTNLHTLKLDNNRISDISALGSLTNLEYLSLINNKISDISALNNLKKLDYLDLTDNRITDYSPIEHLNIQHMFPRYVTKGKAKNKKRNQKESIYDDIFAGCWEALAIVNEALDTGNFDNFSERIQKAMESRDQKPSTGNQLRDKAGRDRKTL